MRFIKLKILIRRKGRGSHVFLSSGNTYRMLVRILRTITVNFFSERIVCRICVERSPDDLMHLARAPRRAFVPSRFFVLSFSLSLSPAMRVRALRPRTSQLCARSAELTTGGGRVRRASKDARVLALRIAPRGRGRGRRRGDTTAVPRRGAKRRSLSG